MFHKFFFSKYCPQKSRPSERRQEARSLSTRFSGFEKLEPRQLLAADATVQFHEDYLLGYDPSQDRVGSVAFTEDSQGLQITGNTWKAVQLSYNVTPNTVIEFDYQSSSQGEIQGIGIDADLDFDWTKDLFFAVYGTQQGFANRDLPAYDGQGAQHYRLPLGEYFQGDMNYLVFMNDNDIYGTSSESWFSNVVVYEEVFDMESTPVVGYGGSSQHEGGEAQFVDSNTFQLTGNTWQAMLYSYEVTPRTRLEFDFYSPQAGELQGIGIDTDLQLSQDDVWFKLQGTESGFGISDFESLADSESQHYSIPLGDYYQGAIRYLTFGNDLDLTNASGLDHIAIEPQSTFSNVRVYEEGIDFRSLPVLSYGGSKQDVEGQYTISGEGESIALSGNTWKAIPYQYEVTANTVIELEFTSNSPGELFGIGVDTDLNLSNQDAWFTLAGSQSHFGIRDYMGQDSGAGHYILPIGEHFQGMMQYLTFGNDHDVSNPTAQSQFESVRIYEMEEMLNEPVYSYDVVVYTATPSGIMTAVEAARQGKSVVIIEPSSHVGGMMSSGLGQTDSKYRSAVGGLSLEFFERVHDYYSQPDAWTSEDPEDYEEYYPTLDTMWRFEPHVAEAIFEDFLDELFIPVVRQQRLDRDDGVVMDGQTILSITTEQDATFTGKVFVDSSYEGDLMAAAGVTYTVGREANDVYGESYNGVQPTNKLGASSRSPVDPYVIPGDPSSGLIYGVQTEEIAPRGTGDDLLQAYTYRLTLSRDPDNQVPFEQPANYDESKYELLFRFFESGNNTNPFSTTHAMPNLKTDSNGAGVFTIDMIGANYDYAEASYAERELILQEHQDYIQGLLWTMVHHERIPGGKQTWASQFGFSADEYTDNGYFPRQIYVREARRMVSDYVMTEANGMGERFVEDNIGFATYNLDSHHVQRYVGPNGEVLGEGNVTVSIPAPFGISYRSIVPQEGEANNLIVPVAVSASHITFGGIRMEPTFMVLGHTAGAAASLVIDGNTTVQDLDYEILRQELIAGGQVLEY